MLKLIVSNNEPGAKISPSSPDLTPPASAVPFSAEIRLQGPHLYLMKAQDPSHCLACDLFLEIENFVQDEDKRTVICHFPVIDDDDLIDLVEEDETLYGITMIHFQIKILTQLFAFCLDRDIPTLTMYIDDAQAEALGIYREFLFRFHSPTVASDPKTRIEFPVNEHVVNDWAYFMEQVVIKFRQTLWKDQRDNIAVQRYLKYHPLAEGL